MGPVTGVIAHGGVAGAIAESILAIAVIALFAVVWVRERRSRSLRSRRRGPARLRDGGDDSGR